ncbi:MAG: hypothetical protein HOP28_02100 [Gemmatimonadales bacterium]|nr:hypothetical protein [Gemmatimonadales bacterium]
MDDAGHVFVSDFQEPRILVLALDGQLLATIGRKGRGPGEFTAPTGPVVDAHGRLFVRNMEQVVRFLPDPKSGLPTQFDQAFTGPAMAPWRSKLGSVIDQMGRFHFPLQVGLRDGLTHYAYRRYDPAGRVLDSLPVPIYPTTRATFAGVRTGPGGGRMVFGVNVVPFHPMPTWIPTPAGTLLSGAANTYELMETSVRGERLRTISLAQPPIRIPERERAESAEALKRRIDSLPVPISEVSGASEEVKAGKLPSTYPMYVALAATPAGEIWVQRWPPPELRGRTVLDVFAPTGVYQRTVIISKACAVAPALIVRNGILACVVIDQESGAESVLIASVSR